MRLLEAKPEMLAAYEKMVNKGTSRDTISLVFTHHGWHRPAPAVSRSADDVPMIPVRWAHQ
ncbi:hypothetical protein, partial [Paraburkholderia sp. SIMBA_027]|uniref:hypothetical protein n=1 Tax=Paraburkholderia sp. SIMBA_027 TaxID=3085770 RepID=UPI00397C1A71